MKTFVTIFEKCENIHLIKDVGQIPYFMYKNFSYDATIVTLKNEVEYKYLDNEVKGLRLQFIPKIKFGRISLSVIWYLIKNSRKIDVLHLFHHREPSYIYSIIYKYFNPKGHLYLKSDKGYRDLLKNDGLFENSKLRHKVRSKLFDIAIKYIDTISIESEKGCQFLQAKYMTYGSKFIYLTNALDIEGLYKRVPLLEYKDKENIVITVGRIGAKEKNNSMLLDSIALMNLNDWRVIFIGPIEKKFQIEIDKFYSENLMLQNKVIFTGAIYDRDKLYEWYAKSKLFCLTSLEESFGFVLIEAMAYENYIVTTDVSSAREITNNEMYGTIINNKLDLIDTVNNFILDDSLNKKLQNDVATYTHEKYDWKQIVKILENRINISE